MAKAKKQGRDFWPDHAKFHVEVTDRDGMVFSIYPAGKEGDGLYGFPDDLTAQERREIEEALVGALACWRNEMLNKVVSFPKEDPR